MAANALQNLVREMEWRYGVMSVKRTRSLAELNKLRVREGDKPLPYILCVIDELADLMMVAPADVEDSIIRLAQKARAVGIHLVLATQSPRVDVITGMIKANVPSRIAFSVSSQTDSRVILDQNGAESLLGQGDMLFSPVGTSRLQRIQGAYIDEPQIEALTSFWARQGEPELREDLLEEVEAEAVEKAEEEGFDPDEDPLLGDAISLVVEMGTASTSMLQRRLRLGYTRAGRLIDMLERRGDHLRLRGLQAAPGAGHRGRSAARAGRPGARARAASPSRSGCRPTTCWTDACRKAGAAQGFRGAAGSLRAPMPDIGTTLREARMRARIDISEIEAETKIRAKYLRALENEEWDLLPGPTYVKSFLRTYADALGLDGKLLIEEYKLRHERLSDVELQPIAPARPARAPAPRRAAASRAAWLRGRRRRRAAGRRCWVVGNRNGDDGATQAQHAAARDEPAGARPPRRQEGVDAKKKQEGQGQAEGRAPDDRRHRAGLRVPEGGRQAHAGPRHRPHRRRAPGARTSPRASACSSGNVRGAADRQRQVAQRPVRRPTASATRSRRAGCAALPAAQWPRCPTA